MKKQFIVEMDAEGWCLLANLRDLECQAFDIPTPCRCDLSKPRPDFCPLVEIKETSPYWEHKF